MTRTTVGQKITLHGV